MATEYSLAINGQPYFDSEFNRKVTVFFSEPDEGINPDTGILLLISGFEGDTSSNVYKKMRLHFSDQQNLVVVQCDYFGCHFMGSKTMTAVHKKMQSMADQINEHLDRTGNLPEDIMKEDLEQYESLDDFCELGLFQALDNLKALKSVIEILTRRNLAFDYNRIIAYGFSHGAYLALFCNALLPNLFSGIIDNSGWVYPVYLYRPRISSAEWRDNETTSHKMLYVLIHYKGRQWIDDLEIYNLRRLYSQFENHAKIISFHGENDGLVPLKEKVNFIDKVNNASLYVVKEKDIDHIIFNNTQHGMGSDFLALFHFVLSIESFHRIPISGNPSENIWQNQTFVTKKYIYTLSDDLEIQRTPV